MKYRKSDQNQDQRKTKNASTLLTSINQCSITIHQRHHESQSLQIKTFEWRKTWISKISNSRSRL